MERKTLASSKYIKGIRIFSYMYLNVLYNLHMNRHFFEGKNNLYPTHKKKEMDKSN